MRHWIWVIMIIGAFAGPAPYREARAESGAERGIALIRVGDLPEELPARVRDFVEMNTAIPVRVREAWAGGEGITLQDVGQFAGERREPEDVFLIALSWLEVEQEEHAIYLHEQNVAVVNARALYHPEDREIFGRRLEKVTMRSVGVMLDVDPVPNPHSAMFPYRNMAELDAMGRNYDPPSLRNVQRAARERGIDLIRGSPYVIIDL